MKGNDNISDKMRGILSLATDLFKVDRLEWYIISQQFYIISLFSNL